MLLNATLGDVKNPIIVAITYSYVIVPHVKNVFMITFFDEHFFENLISIVKHKKQKQKNIKNSIERLNSFNSPKHIENSLLLGAELTSSYN